MADQPLRINGWLVAEAMTEARWASFDQRGQLFLFRTQRDWTLLTVSRRTELDTESGEPTDGHASVYAKPYADLATLRADLDRSYLLQTWRSLVKSGAGADGELARLWRPVRLKEDLDKASVRNRGFARGGSERAKVGWNDAAIALTARRLGEMGFFVVEASSDFGVILDPAIVRDREEFGIHVVGAARVVKYGLSTLVVIAVDDAGEIYARMPEAGFEPGDVLRWPPEPVTGRLADAVEEWLRQRRAGARQQRLEKERSDG